MNKDKHRKFWENKRTFFMRFSVSIFVFGVASSGFSFLIASIISIIFYIIITLGESYLDWLY